MPDFNAYIVHCVRTPGGKRNGGLSGHHPAELGATVVDAIVDQTKIDANQIDDVMFGCVSCIGAQSSNIARMVVLASKSIPEEVPGVTIDRQCGSSQQALHLASQAVMNGNMDVVIAGGVEVMSLVPIGSNASSGFKMGHGIPVPESVTEKYRKQMEDGYGPRGLPLVPSQFGGAEMLAVKYDISRLEADEFALLSQNRAAKATKEGRFKREIVPVPYKVNEKYKGNAPSGNVTQDEGIRATTAEGLAKLKSLNKNGVLTAANASQICDGASAVLICNERGLKKLGVKPRARVVDMAVVGSNPIIMLEGPIPVTKKILAQSKMSLDQMDLYEVNEAFCTIPLSWKKALNANMEKLNVNGGAMALGHPLGATGTKLTTTLIHELERTNKRYGLLAICQALGTSNATIFEITNEPLAPSAKL